MIRLVAVPLLILMILLLVSYSVKTMDNFEKFTDELAPLDSLPPGNDDSTLKKDLPKENFQVYSNPLFEFDDNFKSSTINPLFDEMEEDVKIKNSNVSDEPVLLNTPLSDKVECFAPEDNNDEIDAFLAMEVSSTFEKSPVDDSEHAQVEIDIFLVPDDLIPPGVKNDDSEDEDNELPNLDCDNHGLSRRHCVVMISILVTPRDSALAGCDIDHQDDPSIPRPLPEPSDVEKCFEPEAGILIIKVFKGVSKPHDFMADILPTLPTLVSDLTFILFLSSFLSFRSENFVFDPGIVTFHKPVAFSMKVSCSKYCSP
ncbi:hypothetical protein Tco_0805639 [Tanacetum coccineum]